MFRSILIFSIATLVLLLAERSFVLITLLDFSHYTAQELVTLLYASLRFDLKLIATVLLIFYLLPITLLLLLFNNHSAIIDFFKKVLLLLFLLLAIICFTDYGFFHFFGNAIDQLFFGIQDDGFTNVIKSVQGNTMVIRLVILLIVMIIFSQYLFAKEKKTSPGYHLSKTTIAVRFILLFILLLVFARGSFSTFPLSRDTNIFNSDSTLNALALNSPLNLYYAYHDHQYDSLTFSTQAVLSAAKVSDLNALKQAAGYTQHTPLLQKTSPKTQTPPHIILVLKEGWSTHIALTDTPDNNVLGAFTRHKQQDYFFTKFFSTEYGTNPTLERLLLNSPVTPLSQSKENKTCFYTSNVLPFKKAGYHTQFISGSNKEWRKIGNFYLHQGFDEFYSRTEIEKAAQRISDNPWGAYSEDLFSFVKQKLQNTSDQPTFSFVLTTNNHSPIVLPPDHKAPTFKLSNYQTELSNKELQSILEGYHYQTNAFGEFLDWLKASKFADNTIVVATGDHILKGFYNYNQHELLHLKYAVPLYLYIPPRYQQTLNTPTAGAHTDIFPTLFDLSLSNSPYFSFGTSLLNKTPQTAYGAHAGGRYFIFPNGVSSRTAFSPWKNKDLHLDKKETPLTPQQAIIVKQTPYKEALAKYYIFKSVEDKKAQGTDYQCTTGGLYP